MGTSHRCSTSTAGTHPSLFSSLLSPILSCSSYPSSPAPPMSEIFPEIAAPISDHLRPHDIQSCLRVSKSWYTAFIPRLYRHVVYKSLYQGDELGDPTLCQVFHRYSHHMRSLRLYH